MKKKKQKSTAAGLLSDKTGRSVKRQQERGGFLQVCRNRKESRIRTFHPHFCFCPFLSSLSLLRFRCTYTTLFFFSSSSLPPGLSSLLSGPRWWSWQTEDKTSEAHAKTPRINLQEPCRPATPRTEISHTAASLSTTLPAFFFFCSSPWREGKASHDDFG